MKNSNKSDLEGQVSQTIQNLWKEKVIIIFKHKQEYWLQVPKSEDPWGPALESKVICL